MPISELTKYSPNRRPATYGVSGFSGSCIPFSKIGVMITPGSIIVTRIPKGFVSAARISVRASAANFEVQ